MHVDMTSSARRSWIIYRTFFGGGQELIHFRRLG